MAKTVKRNAIATYDKKSDQYIVRDEETGEIIYRSYNQQYAKMYTPKTHKIIKFVK